MSNTSEKKQDEKPLIETSVPGFLYNPNRSLSYSSLKSFAKSPLHWVNYIQSPFVETDAMTLGKMVDVLILEEEKFPELFAVAPKVDRRTMQGKIDWTTFCTANAGKTVVTDQMHNEAKQMSKSVLESPNSRKILDRISESKTKIYWTDKETGLLLSCELDGLGEGAIAEIKTTQDADPDKFVRDAIGMGYHIQCALQIEAVKKKRFKFPTFFYLGVESSDPFAVNVMKPDEQFIEFGQWTLRKLLQEFKYCADNNLFHQGYEFRSAVGYSQLSLPGWVKYKID